MKQHTRHCGPNAKPLCFTAGVALSALATIANAEDDAATKLTKPESNFSVGVGYLTDDNIRYGQYNGVTNSQLYGLIDFDFLKRDDLTGSWVNVVGRDLGLDSREASIGYERQGQWGVFVDYSRIPRFYPETITTGLTGIGTSTQTINGTALRPVQFSTVRNRTTLGFDTLLPGDLTLKVSFRNEDKNGSRIFGRGTAQFLAEPIDSRTQQVDATLNYAGKQLQLTGGYYGSFYTNHNSVLDVNTGADIALPLDNQAHQLYVAGNYAFTRATHATFKASYTHATQDENFFTKPDLPGNTQTSLDGRIDTTALQLGLTSRLMPVLSLTANLRYEDRDDKTPLVQYISPSSSRDGFNTPFSRTTTAGKVEATYSAPFDFAFTGGVDYEHRKRSVLSIRQASWREENDEITYRLEARRSLSATINGALSYAHSDRDGSDFLPANNNTANDLVAPIHFADRKRDKFRLLLDWSPVEALSLQLNFDDAKDKYSGLALGPSSGSAQILALDGAYTLSDTWQINAWYSHDETVAMQATLTAANGTVIPAQNWYADLRATGDAFGAGVQGKPTEKLSIGADIHLQRDKSEYNLTAVIPDNARLPDITTKVSTVELFGHYAVRENFAFRMELGYNKFETDDWTWTNWVYADNTTVAIDPKLSGVFVGLSVQYSIW